MFLDFSDLVVGIFCPGMCCSAPPKKLFVLPLCTSLCHYYYFLPPCTTLFFFVLSLFTTLCHFVLSFPVYSFPTFLSLVWYSQLINQLVCSKLYCFQIHYQNLQCSGIGAKFDKMTTKFFNLTLLLIWSSFCDILSINRSCLSLPPPINPVERT